jgi:hypothetical protein
MVDFADERRRHHWTIRIQSSPPSWMTGAAPKLSLAPARTAETYAVCYLPPTGGRRFNVYLAQQTSRAPRPEP